MKEPGKFTEFSVVPENSTNGLLTNYLINFKATIPVSDGDIFYLTFPSEIKAPKEPYCEQVKCLSSIMCNSEKGRIVAVFSVSDL